LDSYLKSHGVTSVFICGLAADYCVYFTALDALSLGYEATILDESTKAIDPINFVDLKENFRKKGGKISAFIL